MFLRRQLRHDRINRRKFLEQRVKEVIRRYSQIQLKTFTHSKKSERQRHKHREYKDRKESEKGRGLKKGVHRDGEKDKEKEWRIKMVREKTKQNKKNDQTKVTSFQKSFFLFYCPRIIKPRKCSEGNGTQCFEILRKINTK